MTGNTSHGDGSSSRTDSASVNSQPAATDVARAPSLPMMRPASSSMLTEPAVEASSATANRCSSKA